MPDPITLAYMLDNFREPEVVEPEDPAERARITALLADARLELDRRHDLGLCLSCGHDLHGERCDTCAGRRRGCL